MDKSTTGEDPLIIGEALGGSMLGLKQKHMKRKPAQTMTMKKK